MAIYYHLCGYIGEKVLKKEPNVFGGWRSIPVTPRAPKTLTHTKDEIEAKAAQAGYFFDTFSDTMWLEQFKNFTQLIRELSKQASSGTYVATTDIANFYDSIELPRLVQKLRRDVQGELHEEIELLEMFLALWDRRTTGYSRSSKGIPQEIISDGSRFLSHYYLQDFDGKFMDYCRRNKLLYVRWADDMLIFGPSKRALEHAIHRASRILLSEGLNLNAHKTRILSRNELARNRGLDVLSAIDSRNAADFRRKLRSAISWHRQGNQLRLDTVFRASLGYTFRLGKNAKTFEKNFLFETVDENPDILATLNDVQLIRLISIADDPKEMFVKVRSSCLTRPYAGARANFLLLIRKHSRGLVRIGISERLQKSSVEMIARESGDSVIIRTICAPPALAAIP
ncbi:RNA-directed DNA polymerase [Shimia sp. CNT1-13L.2]|uniref:RNA-directed DNA polymerase n=1 Tax=Shimia sp. CNT1-13L.2 TaxID=2959663 RepID=UPI0020CD4C5D|nr:RNA-directed DNA polymerase [Shimia sp. CNT1-13L.2]MCP9480793.1 RNA-directed DNA polymerase [Shimia sp. CNT1-13L.2]